MEDNKNELREIYLLLQDLDKRIEALEIEQNKTEAGIVTEGAPQFVKKYLERIKEGGK